MAKLVFDEKRFLAIYRGSIDDKDFARDVTDEYWNAEHGDIFCLSIYGNSKIPTGGVWVMVLKNTDGDRTPIVLCYGTTLITIRRGSSNTLFGPVKPMRFAVTKRSKLWGIKFSTEDLRIVIKERGLYSRPISPALPNSMVWDKLYGKSAISSRITWAAQNAKSFVELTMFLSMLEEYKELPVVCWEGELNKKDLDAVLKHIPRDWKPMFVVSYAEAKYVFSEHDLRHKLYL